MFEIMYTSSALVRLQPDEMTALLRASRERNAGVGITGSLLHVQDPHAAPGFFVQVLEGPKDMVQATYARISRDARHTDVTTMHERVTQGRAFRDWTMRLESITSAQARAALERTGRPPESGAQLSDLLKQPRHARSLVAAFRTVTATAARS